MRRVSAKEKNPCVLPNFIIVGAAKCGTTSLYHYLMQHPEVYMSSRKEPTFLCGGAMRKSTGHGDALHASRAVKTFDDYCRLFEKGIGKKAVGEASTSTLFHFEWSILAIQRYLGDPRIVIILRDPVARAYSAYNYQVMYGWEQLSFADALNNEEKRDRKGYWWHWNYRNCGLYARQVHAFQEKFSHVQVLLYDDLEINANALIRALYTFLEVDPDFIPDISRRHNITGVPRWGIMNDLFNKPKRLHKIARTIGGAILGADRWVRLRERLRTTNLQEPPLMEPEIEHELRRFYRADILKLQDYIGRDLSFWLENGKNK